MVTVCRMFTVMLGGDIFTKAVVESTRVGCYLHKMLGKAVERAITFCVWTACLTCLSEPSLPSQQPPLIAIKHSLFCLIYVSVIEYIYPFDRIYLLVKKDIIVSNNHHR